MSSYDKLNQASFGAQRALEITSAPTGAEGVVGKKLINAGALTVNGDYYCRFELAGLAEVIAHLTATFASGTVTSEIVSCYLIPTANVSDATAHANPYRYQSFSGHGALTSATRQTATLAATKGEQVGILKLTLASMPVGGATFTQAEYNGR